MFQMKQAGESYRLELRGKCLWTHEPAAAGAYVGTGAFEIDTRAPHQMARSQTHTRVALTYAHYDPEYAVLTLTGGGFCVRFRLIEENDTVSLHCVEFPGDANRFWLRVPLARGQAVYGGGMQSGPLNLRGLRVPFQVRAQDAGADKALGSLSLSGASRAGSPHPVPLVITGDFRYYHIGSTAYSAVDCTGASFAEFEIWDKPKKLLIGIADGWRETLLKITHEFGRFPMLPSWCHSGIVLGLSGGADAVRARLEAALGAGIQVSAVCIQDWCGHVEGKPGHQPQWNWQPDTALYPDLPEWIGRLRREGIRVLGYLTPHLRAGTGLFEDARSQGLLALGPTAKEYLQTYDGQEAGTLDLTHSDSGRWLDARLFSPMIALGFSGWMSDCGEHLPLDAAVMDGDGAHYHNLWPVLWQAHQQRFIENRQLQGEVIFFTRSGYSGSAQFTPLTWLGARRTDWSPENGLPSALSAALSLGLSGIGMTHMDVGGTMTIPGRERSEELLKRWAELALFFPLFRTVQGTLPGLNAQFDSTAEMLEFFAHISRLVVALAPYQRACVANCAAEGTPVCAPLLFAFPSDEAASAPDQFMLGGDLLVAPALHKGMKSRAVHLPAGDWVHLWSGEPFAPGRNKVGCPFGQPPAFYRGGSAYTSIFKVMRDMAAAFD